MGYSQDAADPDSWVTAFQTDNPDDHRVGNDVTVSFPAVAALNWRWYIGNQNCATVFSIDWKGVQGGVPPEDLDISGAFKFPNDPDQRALCRVHNKNACDANKFCSWNVFWGQCNEFGHQPLGTRHQCNKCTLGVVKKGTFWRWKTTKDGTDAHICIDKFRFVKANGEYGVPIDASSTQPGHEYGQSSLRSAFNVGGSTTSESASHWCAWGLTVITVEFSEPVEFVSYKFVPHSSSCTNDPQAWEIQVSEERDSGYETIQTVTKDCPLDHLSDYNTWTLDEEVVVNGFH